MSIKCILVDDHTLFRDGLRRLLESEPDFEVVGEASDAIEALDKVRELQPDVVLMDLRMPVVDGVEAIRAITAEFPAARILALSTYEGDADIRRALDAGARGYVVKSDAARDLLAAVEAVSQHRVFTALHGRTVPELT